MPTGYTYEIAEGKLTSFEKYAMQCARAFGALIMMRDDPSDAPIPEFTPSEHEIEREAVAKAHLAEVQNRTDAEWVEKHQEYVSETNQRRADALKKIADERYRYESMMAKAKRFVSPSKDHDDFARFIVTQIEESIKWDCDTEYYDKLKTLGLHEWKQKEKDDAASEARRASKALMEEKERCRSRNEWVRQLRSAVAAVGD